MGNEIQTFEIEPTATIAPRAQFSLTPTSLAEAMEYAKIIAGSDLAPKDYRGKPANVLVAVQMGAELGIAPMQAIQNIAVINGRPCVWGDLFLAIIQHSDAYEWHSEEYDAATESYTCMMKRKGNPQPFAATFSKADAVKAGLWDKAGPWTNYRKRMLQMRARGFAGRDGFADVLKGIALREEVQDYIDIDRPKPQTVAMPRRASVVETVAEPEAAAPSDTADRPMSDAPPAEPDWMRDQDVPPPDYPFDPPASVPSPSPDGWQVTAVGEKKRGSNAKGEWIQYGITIDGVEHTTFEARLAEDAERAMAGGLAVVPHVEQKGKYKNLVGLMIIGGGND